MKKQFAASIIAALCVLSSIPLLPNPASSSQQSAFASQQPGTSVVSGTDLYAEQIQFYLAGQNCLIRQSAITSDSYIIDRVPLDDIAFKNASVIVLASNGIYPTRYIDVHVPFNELTTFQLAVNGIVVYLSYNDSVVDMSVVNSRSHKAIKILQEALGVELFEQTDANARTFTLYGVAPDWSTALRTFTSQLPKDGYFKYFDTARLGSTSYTSSKHLSTGFASINQYGGALDDFTVGGISDLLGLLDFNASGITDFLGLNFTGEVPQVLEARTNLLFVQYEGAAGGITFANPIYTFNAKAALGLPESAQFKPSANVWNSMFDFNPIGILGTMIDVNVVTGNVTSWNLGPNRLTIDDTILDTIYMASGLGGSMGIDIVAILDALEFVIQNVFFITNWEKTGALSKLYANVNLTRAGYVEMLAQAGLSPDILDFLLDEIMLDTSPLALVGFRGLPYVPTGLLKAIPNIVATYKNPLPNQPDVIAQIDTDLSIKPFQETISLMMNLTNIGTQRAWGTRIGHGNANLTDLIGGSTFNFGTIEFEVRGFFIPALASSDPLGMYYGIENLLLDISSYSNKNDPFPTLGWAIYQALLAADAVGPTNRPGYDDGLMDLHEAGLLTTTDPYNYIEPGESMIVDLSDASLTGLYTAFDGENSSFTTASVITGTQAPPLTLNNNTNAREIDGVYWAIDTVGSGTNRAIVLNFTFANETSNVTSDDIAAFEFRYLGTNNVTIWSGGNASFVIWNYNTGTWVPISNLTRNPVSINQTSILSSSDTFRIYDGDNDTANQTITIADYMSGPNNTVRIQLHLGNNASTRLSIDSFDMDYLQRNQTLLLIPAQPFAYTDKDSITIRQATSNSLYVGSQNASALVVKQSLADNRYFKYVNGDPVTVIVSIENKGNRTATGVNISTPLPGIITDIGNFTGINGDYLNGSVGPIVPGASVTLSYEFIIPNSERIPGMLISYNQTEIVQGQRDFTIRGNDWYVDAYVDYKTFRPYLIEVNATMSHVNPSSVPDIRQSFFVNYSVATAHASSLGGPLDTTLPRTDITAAIDRNGTKNGYFIGNTSIHVDEISSNYGIHVGDTIRITNATGSEQWNIVKEITYTTHKEANIILNSSLTANCSDNSIIATGVFAISDANPVSINLDGQGRGSVAKNYTRCSYKGYLVPSPNFDTEQMAALLRYVTPAPLAIGEMEITITKQVQQNGVIKPVNFNVIRGSKLIIVLNVTNTGTLNVGAYEKLVLGLRQGFTIDDNFGYDQEAFSVLTGDVTVSNMSLAPGQSASFNYTLQAEKVGSFTLGSTIKSYYFLREAQATSNAFVVTIDEKPELVATYLGVSIGVTILIIYGSVYTKKKQERALSEFKRRDKVLYDELTKSKNTFDEYLD